MTYLAVNIFSEKLYQHENFDASAKRHKNKGAEQAQPEKRDLFSWAECPSIAPGPDVIEEAREITRLMQAGVPATVIALDHENLTQFAIGHLIANILKKKLFRPGFDDLNKIYDLIAPGINQAARRHYDGAGHQVGRTTVIDELRKKGIVDENTTVRALKPAGTTPSIRDIGTVLEETSSYSLEQIISASRERNIVHQRFRLIWIMRHICGHPLSVIGRNVGGRDHTTVLNSLNKVALERASDEGRRNEVTWLCERSDAMGVRSNYAILRQQDKMRRFGNRPEIRDQA